MDPEQYDVLFDVEERHWWYVGMRAIAASFLGAPHQALRILDAGCGTGGTTAWLRRYGAVVGIDYSELALERARARIPNPDHESRVTSHESKVPGPGTRVSGLSTRDFRLGTPLVQASVQRLPFASGSFDLVTSFDVLYHRAAGSDRDALLECARVLRPRGLLLIRLPALNWLRGAHDVAVHTKRRYTASELGRKLAEAGFDVKRLSYANSLLLPVAMLKRLTERQDKPTVADLSLPPGPINRALQWVLETEACWLRRRWLPIGLSVVALAERVY